MSHESFTIMGVVNVTPDSFSDGGRWLAPEAAAAHGRSLAAQGADLLDVGGESTRPGAESVAADEESRRVLPVIAALAAEGLAVSVDTSKASVAERALAAGASYVNDVTAFAQDPGIAAVVAQAGCRCCLMHMRGQSRTMQEDPRYDDVVDDVKAFLLARVRAATDEGVAEDRIELDPGIGFGKTVAHNLQLLRRLDELVALGFPIVLGTSRKAFLGTLTGRSVPHERVAATVATAVLGLQRGARVFRVHDVAAVRDALVVAEAVLGA